MENIHITLLLGENEVREFEETETIKNLKNNLVTYNFDTIQEKNAFLFGLKSGLGWNDYKLISDNSFNKKNRKKLK
jgi:hypothetical protein